MIKVYSIYWREWEVRNPLSSTPLVNTSLSYLAPSGQNVCRVGRSWDLVNVFKILIVRARVKNILFHLKFFHLHLYQRFSLFTLEKDTRLFFFIFIPCLDYALRSVFSRLMKVLLLNVVEIEDVNCNSFQKLTMQMVSLFSKI